MTRSNIKSGHGFEETCGYPRAVRGGDHVYVAGATAFGEIRPASTLIQVIALTPNTARVEIEATAVVTK